MSLCKASAFARLAVNPFRRTMLLVNKVMTPKIPCEIGRSPGDLCALSKAGLIPFETILSNMFVICRFLKYGVLSPH